MKILGPCCVLLLSFVMTSLSRAQLASPELTRFGAGAGPTRVESALQLLDDASTFGQSNCAAYPVLAGGPFESTVIRGTLRVDEGGDGGAFALLSTAEYGSQGPGPYLREWTVPNLRASFAVGIDVHDPPSSEPFGPWGNYQSLPEREVSLHWDGVELVKRVAPVEFRGQDAPLEIVVQHVSGGADVTVRIAGGAVYENYFIAGLTPYRSRLAVGASTRSDAATRFDVKALSLETGGTASPVRPPLRFEIFHHVMTDNSKTSYESTVSLPPLEWAFGRVILDLEIHDGGEMWDEWDRNGELSLLDDEGRELGIVPFITSYRTACRWKVDVTHFRPLFTGERKFRIAAGTTFYKNRGYLMSATLEFHHGTPALEPFSVVPLWHGTARYKSEENHFQDFFEDQAVSIPENTAAARIFTTTTGHSQIGEFTPSNRTIRFKPERGASKVLAFENTLWKTDCYLNPNRPQFGTWKYSRAGWAPGDVVRPWWIDLTESLIPGAEAEVTYEPKPYDFPESRPEQGQINEASHVVRSYLILYRESEGAVPAPILRVTGVQGGSSAAKAGIRAGDYLGHYEDRPLESVEDLRAAIAANQEKETVTVIIYRGSERLELQLKPGRLGVNLAAR